jgi:AraC-like DNA-binding protein
MDPLSDVLSLLRPSTFAFRGLDASGAWALAFAANDGIKCYAINSGACWLDLEDTTSPVHLSAGDVVLLPTGSAFRLYSVSDAPPIDAVAFFSAFPAGEIATLNGGGAVSGVGGYFDFEGRHADVLLTMLPAVVHIRAEANKAALRGSIERLMSELRQPQPGSSLIAEHLAQMLLIEALRLHLAERSHVSAGWLFALADRQMNAVIAAIHADPGRKWTLQDLARVAGMSRSSFAARFRAAVGEPAMDYLTRWRMMVAADRLARGGASIAIIALAVGYESESAFGAAFKRIIGQSPRRFAKGSAV